MKPKKTPLEKLLRRSEAPLPPSLRLRTLQRMGLRPVAPAWYARPWIWAPALAGSLALSLLWVLSPRAGQTPALHAPQPLPINGAAERNEELAYASRHPGIPGPTTAMQVLQAKALMHAEDAGIALVGPDAASRVAVAPALGAEAPMLSQEQRSAPASASVVDLFNARGEAAKAPGREPYRLSVKKNRIRPAMGEQVELELQTGQNGPVHMRVIDMEGRLVRDLVELDDSSGPIVVRWDGRSVDGQEAPSGAYTIIIQSPAKTEKVGVLIIR